MRGLVLLCLGAAAVALAYRAKRSEARTEAADDSSEWHLAAEPVAGAYCGIHFIYTGRGTSPVH